jgi:hypothetical protein
MHESKLELSGVRVSAAFVFVGDLASIDRLVRELESRPGPRCVYVKTSVGRLKIVPDTSAEGSP